MGREWTPERRVSLKDWMEIVQHAVLIGATIIAGGWAIFHFSRVEGPSWERGLEASDPVLSVTAVSSPDDKGRRCFHIIFQFEGSNYGVSRLDFEKAQFEVARRRPTLRPDGLPQDQVVWGNWEPVHGLQGEVTWSGGVNPGEETLLGYEVYICAAPEETHSFWLRVFSRGDRPAYQVTKHASLWVEARVQGRVFEDLFSGAMKER